MKAMPIMIITTMIASASTADTNETSGNGTPTSRGTARGKLPHQQNACRFQDSSPTAGGRHYGCQPGLTNAVPARVTVHTDARIRPIRLGNMTINFKLTAPSRLYWAGRPAMCIVQALHWLRDMLSSDQDSIQARLKAILNDPTNGLTIRDDLQSGLRTLPQWMQEVVSALLT